MLVFDTSAMADQRIIAPREVLNELKQKDDEVASWAKARAELFVEPIAEVQTEAGAVLAMLPNPGMRDGADPFVVAEAKVKRMTVVTYEGRSFSGAPTKNWARRMPGICTKVGVECCTLPEALAKLGASF
jgi:Domain of unknown function (DUF4411)